MKKVFIFGVAIVVSVVMLMSSCKKEELNNNGNNSNTENPGGGSGSGGSGSGDHVIPDAVSDIDGNSYDAVQIGNQVWMAENLRTTRYADSTSIPLGTSTSTTTAYRYAPGPNQSNEENMDNVSIYGYLYNWPAVSQFVAYAIRTDHRSAAPKRSERYNSPRRGATHAVQLTPYKPIDAVWWVRYSCIRASRRDATVCA